MENYDTPRVQQKGREIEVKSKDGCDAVQPCKGEREVKTKKKIKSGDVFERLTAISYFGVSKNKHLLWIFECSCGTSKPMSIYSVLDGSAKSCGCLQKEAASKSSKKHGLHKCSEYNIWAHIKHRCFNEKNGSYASYGGRGITMCDSWKNSFEQFLKDVGRRPSNLYSIDRINNDGNYEPGNVRWATRLVQQNNTRFNKLITFQGEVKTASQWTRQYGLTPSTLKHRLNRGWDIESALTTKPQKKNKAA